MRTEEVTIVAGEHRLAGTKVYPSSGAEPSVLTLHGLGPTATRRGVRYLVDALGRDGHGSLCFEFSGNGDSTGLLAEATLRRRRDETLAAAAHLSGEVRPVLIGTSMGAHLASWTVPELRPRALVLFCPAAYPASATDIAFGDAFPKPGCYGDAPAFAGLRKFDGDLLVVAARQDTVVEADVVDAYVASAVNARTTSVVWLEGFDHFVHRSLPNDDEALGRVVDAIRSVVRTYVPAAVAGGSFDGR